MTGRTTPSSVDPHQLAIWIDMADQAARFDTAEKGMLAAVPMELILAIIEAGPNLSLKRRESMIAAGALILRLMNNDGQHRNESTARMLSRLGLPADTAAVERHG
jgi:hypothetical protein